MKALRIALAAVAIISASPAQADIVGSMMSRIGQGRPHGCPPRRWCGCGLNRVLASLGYHTTGSNRAIDARRYGIHASGFARNTIIVMAHHVGVATGNVKACPAGKVQLVSANHSNRFGVGCYSKRRVIATRKAVR